MTSDHNNNISYTELIILLALMTSLGALTIDLQLPAMPMIAASFGLSPGNEQQWMITSYMIGFSVAQIIYGPISDSLGRKPVLIFGVVVYLLASLACLLAVDFFQFLAARALQGIGAAAARIMVNAITRDYFVGHEMARVTSLIMMIFILVPVLAPTLGSVLLLFGPWEYIIYTYILFALIILGWSVWRLPESLKPEHKRALNGSQLLQSLKSVLAQPVSMVFAVISGLVFSGFMAYLNASEQIFSQMYDAKDRFPQIFGGIALFFGLAAFINAKVVVRLGVLRVTVYALSVLLLANLLGLAMTWGHNGLPPFALWVLYLGTINVCIGLAYGNLIAIAMIPLGQHAGMGASVIGVISALIASVVGIIISQQISDHLMAIVIGFAVTSLLACGLLMTQKSRVAVLLSAENE